MKTALLVAGAVFLLVAVAHLARIVFQLDLTLAGRSVPPWVNGIGLVFAGGLAIWMFSAANRS